MAEWIDTNTAADILGLTGVNRVNAISQAAKAGRLKSRKRPNGFLEVTRQSVLEYRDTRRPYMNTHDWRVGMAHKVMAEQSACPHPAVYTSGERAGRCTRCDVAV